MSRNRNVAMATDPTISFIAGGLSGGVATIITSPLEVIKTRLQSTVGQEVMKFYRFVPQGGGGVLASHTTAQQFCTTSHPFNCFSYLRHVLKTEGHKALFKGLSLSLLGSMPTRAIYFTLYSNLKPAYNKLMANNSNQVHFISAMSAGMLTSSITSPIWVIKTQLQLHDRPHQLLGLRQCVYKMYATDGIRSFYRGLTASYAGSIETAIYFVIYERLKQQFRYTNDREPHPLHCMFVAACSKVTASTLCYPHEVCRTRMRQNVDPSLRKYHSFFQTLLTIWREEGGRGLYGGMVAHQLRVVPNTAIIFFTYEFIVRAMGYITM